MPVSIGLIAQGLMNGRRLTCAAMARLPVHARCDSVILRVHAAILQSMPGCQHCTDHPSARTGTATGWMRICENVRKP
jgi:hypothetical protein